MYISFFSHGLQMTHSAINFVLNINVYTAKVIQFKFNLRHM